MRLDREVRDRARGPLDGSMRNLEPVLGDGMGVKALGW